MQNRNRMTKETITREHKDLRGFGFWLTSMGGIEEKVSLTKGRDYKGGTKTLSQNPSSKYTQKSSQSPEARD